MSDRLALVVPTGRDAVRALDSRTLYVLEQAGEIAREILDARIVEWTEQDWSQRKIADEVGCSQQAIAKRQARLGVEPSSRRGRPRNNNRVVIPSIGDAPDDSVAGEIVDDDDDVEHGVVEQPIPGPDGAGLGGRRRPTNIPEAIAAHENAWREFRTHYDAERLPAARAALHRAQACVQKIGALIN